MTTEKQLKKGQEMWNQVKNDPEKYGKTVLSLKATAAKEKNKNTKIWMNFVSPPKKKKSVQTDVVETVGVQPDKSKSFIFSFSFVSAIQYTPGRTSEIIINNSYRKIKKRNNFFEKHITYFLNFSGILLFLNHRHNIEICQME